MKSILLKSLGNFADILFKTVANIKQEANSEFKDTSANQNVVEVQQYIINRNLRHIEYINQLEKQITANHIQGFNQEFYDELKSSKLICKINTIKTTRSMALNSHAA